MDRDTLTKRIAQLAKQIEWHRHKMEEWYIPMRVEIEKAEVIRKEMRELSEGFLGPLKNARRIKILEEQHRKVEAEGSKFDDKAQEHADAKLELSLEKHELENQLRMLE